MLWLVFLWLLLGILIGLLVAIAQLLPSSWQQHRWFRLSILGALTATVGGVAGIWLVGRPLATWMALWFAVACTLLLPYGFACLQHKR